MHPPADRVTQSLSSLELSAMESAEYSDIFSVLKGVLDKGRLKLRPDSVLFKSSRTSKVDNIAANDMKQAQWMRVAKGFEVKFMMESGEVHKFDGFNESDFPNLSEFIKHNYSLELEEVPLSVKGWNWGKVNFTGSLLQFSVEDKTAFEIPLNQVNKSTKNKNEVTIEFHQSDEAPVSLVEMRFHIPTNQEDEQDPVKSFHEKILAKADVLQATVDAYAIFDDVPCMTPRGHYTVKAYPTFFQLHGKTFNYNIPYNTIIRLFLLEHPDGIHMFIVKCLDPPIRQGQTRHNFVIQRYTKEDMCEITLMISQEDLENKFQDRLSRTMTGPTYEVYARILKELVGRKITISKNYKTRSGAHAINCALKAYPGLLYPLEKAFLFIHKPTVLIRFDEVASVNFARVFGGGTIKSFDFEVEHRNVTTHTFSNIAREDYPSLYDFVIQKKLAVKNKGQRNFRDTINEGMEDSDNEEPDHYLEQMKMEGELKDIEDDDSSYTAESEKDDDLEYDSQVSISESDSDKESEKKGQQEHPSEPKIKDKDKVRDIDIDKDKVREKDKDKVREKEKPREKVREKPKSENRSKKEKPSANGKQAKKSKKNKDPNCPKKPISAYMIWFNEERKNIMEKYGVSSIGETGKKGGELWGTMTGEEKKVYVSKFEVLRATYQEQMKEYLAKGGGGAAGGDAPVSPKQSKSKPSGAMKNSRKRSSPHKGTPSKRFKSQEFVNTEDESSSDGEQVKKKELKQTKLFKKTKKETKANSSGDEMDTGEPKSKPFPKPSSSKGRASTRSQANQEELVALPSGSDYEESIASVASGDKSDQSASGSGSDSD